MQEAHFLKLNYENWKQIESVLESSEKINPDYLAELFIRLTDDLSYANTYYPGSKTAQFLNELTTKIHQMIYKNKKENKSRILQFWKYELPETLASCRKELFYAFIIFLIALLVGIVSTANDDSFVRVMLGDRYVNMTLENIQNNDPMAVYKKMNQTDMFLGITLNNVWASMMTFLAGILLSFGSGYMLFYNGVMLGAFQYFFYQKGFLIQALLTVWIHGVLEISAIILAGCAGIIMGNSILFPGTFPRRHSFVAGARKGLKIIIGMVPIFILAAFL
ncbi:MAG: stage II sporulation protein M, partial [Calditrichota bacterium]